MLEILSSYNCFYVHIKGPDEPAHDGNYRLKTQLIEVIDKYFLGELLKIISLDDCIVCVTADHATPCQLKTHSDDPVPVLISGNGIKGDDVSKFSEKTCKKGNLGVVKHGYELMPVLMNLLKGKT